MPTRMMHGLSVIAVSALFALSFRARACSSDIGTWSSEQMPTAIFSVECERILKKGLPWVDFPTTGDYRSYKNRVEQYRQTSSQDSTDLAEALQGNKDNDALLSQFKGMRNALAEHVTAEIEWEKQNWGPRKDALSAPKFDSAPYTTLLSQIPAEFSEYFRGAVAYHNHDWDTAIAHFNAVLALSPAQRHYRSTWSSFMLGKTYMRKEPARAIPYFQQTRALASEGYPDPLELANASNGWEARALMLSGDQRAAILLYSGQVTSDYVDMERACKCALEPAADLAPLVDDPLTRQILTAWLISHPSDPTRSERWLAAVEHSSGTGTVEDADRLAWCAYQRGDFETAKRWLERADSDSHYTKWIRAKLLLHDGKFDEASVILAPLADDMPFDFPWRVQMEGSDWRFYDPECAAALVGDDLGYSYLKQRRYEDALFAYRQSSNDGQSRYLAESVLTVEELAHFVDTRMKQIHPRQTDRDNLYSVYSSADDILKRRYAREGMWDKAAAMGGENAIKVEGWLKMANNTDLPSHDRAAALHDIGLEIREEGPWFFSPIGYSGVSSANEENISPDPDSPERRSWEHSQSYPRMNYFKYVAADYMWKASELLPNNDILCAKALYTGGMYLKDKHPDEADRFYKALVRRNPNLLIAQQADKKRWFPESFTDTVVYEPLPKHWYGRKRYLAIAFGIAAILTIILAIFIRRAAQTSKNA